MEGAVGEVQKESGAVKQLRDTTRFIRETGALSRDQFVESYGIEIRSAFPGNLDEEVIPVLLCARNEADRNRIGQALFGLAKSEIPVQPIVVDNNSNDGTGEFAKDLGAIVVREEQAGLIHALRRGFSYLKDAGYQGPILTTDADSVPLPTWPSAMSKHAIKSIPDGGISFGRIFHYDHDGNSHAVKNGILALTANMIDSHRKMNGDPRPHGANGIIMTDDSGLVLEKLSALHEDSVNPYATDQQVRDAVVEANGKVDFCSDLDALVVVSGRRFPKIKHLARRVISKEKTHKVVYKDWGK